MSAGSVTGLMPSSKFSTVSISTLTSSIDIIMRDAYPPPTIPFEIECFGFKAPNGVNTVTKKTLEFKNNFWYFLVKLFSWMGWYWKLRNFNLKDNNQYIIYFNEVLHC